MTNLNGTQEQQVVPPIQETSRLPFPDRIEHPRWQVRKHLYQQLSDMFEKGEPLAKLQLNTESFCPWIKSMLSQQHLPSLSEALRCIQLYTRKYPLTVGALNNFVTVLVEKTGFSNLNIKLAEQILQNCMNTPEKAWFVVSELTRYCHHKNQRIALFCTQKVEFALNKFQLNDQKQTLELFKLLTAVLEQTASKEIRNSAIRSMVVVLQHVNEPFEELCGCQFKEIRPVVIRELAAALSNKTNGESKASQVAVNSHVNLQASKHQSSHVDLMAVIPPSFFEIRRLKEANDRIKVLEEMDAKLAKVQPPVLSRDYSQVFNHMEFPLEDQNFLVVSAIMRVLGRLLRLCQVMIPPGNAKRLLTLLVDKYKGPKSKTFNVQVHQLVREFVVNRSLSLQHIVDILTEVVDKSKNLNAKFGVLQWLATEYEDICIGVLTGTEMIGAEQANHQKLKRINTNLKKRLELMVKVDAFLKVKEDLRNVIQVLSNIETGESKANVKARTTTGFMKNSQEPAKFNQTIMHSKSKQRSLNKSPLRKSSQLVKKPPGKHDSPIKTEEDERRVSQRPESLVDRLDKKLTYILNEALSGAKEPAITREFIMVKNTILTAEGRPHFHQVLECLLTFSDQLSCMDLSRSKLTPQLKPRLRQLLHDWVVQCVITSNEWMRQLDDATVQTQLELVLLKTSPNPELVEKFLQSLSNHCQYEALLRKSVNVFKCAGCNPISKQIVSHFLRDRMESADLSQQVLKKCYTDLLAVDGELALSVRGRLRSSTVVGGINTTATGNLSASLISPQTKAKLHTPTRSLSPTKQLDHSRSRQRTNSDISTISDKIMQYQDAIIDNFAAGLAEFKRQLQAIPAEVSLMSVYSKAQYQRVLKTVCCRINLTNWEQAQSFLVLVKQRLREEGLLVLKVVWMTMCLTNIFLGETMESTRNLLFGRLVEGFDRGRVLTCFKESFSAVYKLFKQKEQTSNFSHSVVVWVLDTYLQAGLTVKEIEYLIECLCYCLTVPELAKLTASHLQGVHQNRGSFSSVQKLFGMKLAKYPQLLKAYQLWVDQIVNRQQQQQQRLDITDGTIADLTQIHELSYDEDSRSGIVGGLEVFLQSKKHHSPDPKNSSKTPTNFKLLLSKSNKRQKPLERSHGHSADRPKKFVVNMQRQLEELQRSLEGSKIVGSKADIREVDEYDVQRNRATQLLAEQGADSSECIRQLQDMLLNCQDNPQELLQSLLDTNNSLEGHRRDQFIADLRSCILHTDFLLCLSQVGYRTVLQLLLRLCSSIPQEQQESGSSKTIQYMLHVLLSFKNANSAALACLTILTEEVPSDLSMELLPATRLLLRLIGNCLQKLVGILKPSELRVFELLMGIHKFFKRHPPEKLVVGMPSVGEFQHLFRVLRTVSDQLIAVQPHRAVELVKFLRRPGTKNIYMDYLQGSLKL